MSRDPCREFTPRQTSSILQFPSPALQLIYETAPIGLAFLSPDCRYLQINRRLTEICGISVEDHLGRTVRECVPALAPAVEQIVRSIMETGEPVTGIEVAGQRADQAEERFWVTYWHPLRSPSGNIIGVNVAAEEITERKRNERIIRDAKDAAEQALHHLQETQRSLIESEKFAALGRLVAGVAHEINSPLGTSLTVASTLERKTALFAAEVACGGLTRSRLAHFLQAVGDASSQLIANLGRAAELTRSFKQVAVDESYLDQVTFDLGAVTERVIASLLPGVRMGNVALKLECEPHLTMNSYPGPYRQALTNLFINSVTHAFSAGKVGTIGIKVGAFGTDSVEILVADDGCGMSADIKRQAFDPFFTTRRHQGATGLGLHIVYNIVTNRMGGQVTLTSDPGEGTEVRLILPRVAPARVDPSTGRS